MTIIADYTGNTIKADAFNGPVSGSSATIGTVTITSGAGAPSGSAPQGSFYLNTTGSSTSDRLFVRGSSSWIAVTTAS